MEYPFAMGVYLSSLMNFDMMDFHSSHTSDCYHERPGIRYTPCFIGLFYHCLAALLNHLRQAAPPANTKTVTVLVLTLRLSQGSGHA